MKEFMQKFDKNKDGRIEMSEVSTLKHKWEQIKLAVDQRDSETKPLTILKLISDTLVLP